VHFVDIRKVMVVRVFMVGNAEGELGRELRCPSWRQGFKNELA
jgi:hypothetical protein